MSSKVISRRATYNYQTLRPLFFEIMDSVAGDMIEKNSRVVIKPNLIAPAPPDKAMLTHPMVVRAAVEYVLQRGARPRISDSPAMGSFEKVLKVSGIREALNGLDVEYREFKTSVTIDVGEPFNRIEVAEDAQRADVLINLPKLKTHTQMLLTLGVKNLFGCIVGLRKPEWHLRTGVNREMFARLHLQIYRLLRPSVTIIDGILSMEGQGPGKRGTPRQLGVLMGSKDAIALDITICRMLGIDPDRLLTNKMAKDLGLVDDAIDVEGDLSEIGDFRLPEITPLVFGPQLFHGLMRRHLVQRPVSDDSLCMFCGECWRYCPARAITPGSKKLRFDYDRCIRCYCCIEVCPHGALGAEESLVGKIVRKALKRNKTPDRAV